eukprot:scaffold6375_cov134-Pinguiococcus_pyrenoidosus.AAC.1
MKREYETRLDTVLVAKSAAEEAYGVLKEQLAALEQAKSSADEACEALKDRLAKLEEDKSTAEEEAYNVVNLMKIYIAELEEDKDIWEKKAADSTKWEALAREYQDQVRGLLLELDEQKERQKKERQNATEIVRRWQDYSKILQDQAKAVVLRRLHVHAHSTAKRHVRSGVAGTPPSNRSKLWLCSNLKALKVWRAHTAAAVAAAGAAIPTISTGDGGSAKGDKGKKDWLRKECAALRRELGKMRRTEMARKTLSSALQRTPTSRKQKSPMAQGA